MKTVNMQINSAYRELIGDRHRYIVLYGGAGSGKSVFAAQRYILKLLTQKSCNLLVIRQVGKSNKDSTFALFKQIISGTEGLGGLFEVKESDMRIVCRKNRNEVIFRGLDDAEKLKSITFSGGVLTDIWVEEASEISEEDFNQLDIRLRGGSSKKQILLSFNPIVAEHWLKRRFFDTTTADAAILHTTYKDNSFIDEEYKSLLEGYRQTDPYYYDVYCLGKWGVYGQCFFNRDMLAKRLEEAPKPKLRGEYTYSYNGDGIFDIRLCENSGGMLRVYEMPIHGAPYVIGADTAGEGEDCFAAQVINNISGMQAAVFSGKLAEDEFIKQLYCLGKSYNNALIAPEINFGTHILWELRRLAYGNIYRREMFDSVNGRASYSEGFLTTAKTRPLLLAELRRYFAESPELLCDRETLEEMLSFIRNAKGRAEAAGGKHDDMVIALGIALMARGRQRKRKANTGRGINSGIESFLSYNGGGSF